MIAWMRKAWARRLAKGLMIGMVCTIVFTLSGCTEQMFGMLNPKGIVSFEERKLFFDTLALMLIVVLPVIVMSLTFVYHYQVSHRITEYKPEWGHSYFLESLWWGIPCAIIGILAVLTWKSSHELDPYKSLTGHNEKPMVIHVIALPWKWLFIYPEENIASVNYLEIPVGQQVEFWITADNVPMSAFFIPQLGSQIYAMAGMRTRLHLEGMVTGVYEGLNTQYNGDGFADMHFPVHVVEDTEMQAWIAQMKQSKTKLNDQAYSDLLNESLPDKPLFYSGVKPDLFDGVLDLYMNSTGAKHPRSNQLKMHYQIF